jgi:hypothetical protein
MLFRKLCHFFVIDVETKIEGTLTTATARQLYYTGVSNDKKPPEIKLIEGNFLMKNPTKPTQEIQQKHNVKNPTKNTSEHSTKSQKYKHKYLTQKWLQTSSKSPPRGRSRALLLPF